MRHIVDHIERMGLHGRAMGLRSQSGDDLGARHARAPRAARLKAKASVTIEHERIRFARTPLDIDRTSSGGSRRNSSTEKARSQSPDVEKSVVDNAN